MNRQISDRLSFFLGDGGDESRDLAATLSEQKTTIPFFESPQVTLYQGDCLEVMPQLKTQSFDAIIADLPYGTTACSWDSVIPFEPLWEQYKRLIKPGGAIVLFGSQPFTTDLIMSNRSWFKYELVWEKTQATGHLDVNRRPMRSHENILVFADGTIKYNPQLSEKPVENIRVQRHARGTETKCFGAFDPKAPRLIANNVSYPNSILKFSNETGLHPTQKPQKLLQFLIESYTNPGDRILDNTCGSGTTLAAAKDTGRLAVGIELDKGYCAIAASRCQQLTIFGIDGGEQ